MDLFESFCLNLKERVPFTFSRFGDGEFGAILGREGKNCDGHEYFSDMGEALANVLKSKPRYHVGIQRHALRTMPDVEPWLRKNGLDPELDFVNADVWHHASIKERFNPFFAAIQNKPVLLVAPHVLTKLDIHSYWVEVPERDCWLSVDAIMRGIDNYIDHAEIVLFCASMPAKVMIDQLYYRCGKTKTILDMGSVFMPYVGLSNRSYHKQVIQRLNATRRPAKTQRVQ